MNNYKFTFLTLLILLTSCSYDLDDNLSSNLDISTVEIIRSNSDLYDNIKDIINDDELPNESIACIDFIYPLTLFIFDDTDTYVSTNFILNDEQFSALLDDIDIEHSISISFPITSTLDSGEEFIINTKEELKEAIDNCVTEEVLYECNNLIQNCVWKIGYSYTYENTYLAGIFQENDGFTTLNIDGNILIGSWSPLFIEDELHININLDDDTEIGVFFNFDWKVTYLDQNSLILTNDDRELIINQRCDPNFTNCGNFIFEACELTIDEGVSEFILDDYTACIFDTLELDNEFPISYYATEEEAELETNAILSSEVYNNIETNQIIYVRINENPELNDDGEVINNVIESYIIEITLSVINCD
jgi:hypothetical protein